MTESLPLRVLVVDDSEVDRRLLSALLIKAGFNVTVADGGVAGLAAATEVRPDVIVLDAQMPDLNGYEVCASLKADPVLTMVPVLFISGGNDDAERMGGFEAGAVDYITKPYRPSEVTARVRVQAGLHRSRLEVEELAARLTEANRELERLSMTDGLTGLANRRCFDVGLDREWRRANRDGAPLGLMLIDVDHFKFYNDTYGHPAGDACLRVVGAAVADAARRPFDLAARYGGEEIVMLLPSTPLDGVAVVAERVRAAIASLAIPHSASPVAGQVTVSIGVASVIPDSAASAAALLSAADAALYVAKASGRNQVACA